MRETRRQFLHVTDQRFSELREATAGRLCQRLCETQAFSPAAWQTPRLLGEDSSISARMACKSSEAEITGNSRTMTQPKTQKKMSGCVARHSGRVEQNRCRHSK